MAIPALSAYFTTILYGAAVGAVAYGGYKLVEAANERGYPSMGDYYFGDLTPGPLNWTAKNTDVYAPARPLPNTPDGVPIPDVDVPHTQLGTRGSKKRPGEQYPQAREFGKDGKPVKGIDFTDHGRPQIHPNPHEHPYEPNPTGGTPGRGNARPLEDWRY